MGVGPGSLEARCLGFSPGVRGLPVRAMGWGQGQEVEGSGLSRAMWLRLGPGGSGLWLRPGGLGLWPV